MSQQREEPTNFVVLPEGGLRASGSEAEFLRSLAPATTTALRPFGRIATAGQPRFQVLDSIAENGAKLVKMTPAQALALGAASPGVRIVPEVFFRTAKAQRERVVATVKRMAGPPGVTLRIVSASDPDLPVAGALVVAFTDYANRVGAEGTTDKLGRVTLSLGKASAKVQRLYIYPPRGYWGRFRRNIALDGGRIETLQPLQFPVSDCLAHFAGAGTLSAGKGIKVAVIDTGVGPHPDLMLAGGENTVAGEKPGDFGANGDGHGTHVAGIIASRGNPRAARRGLAPSVKLFGYRVFGKNSEFASSFAIAKAIDLARKAEVDLINLSLGQELPEPLIAIAIGEARANGIAVIAAAGNDHRKKVSYPGSDPLSLAVSALGRQGTFPEGSVETADVARPYGKDPLDFVAAFSNVGKQIAATGPGVGVVSTVPGGYAAMSGTSMACPFVTGVAARLLAKNREIRTRKRNLDRSDAILQMLLNVAREMGFGARFEGRGLPG